MLMIEKQLRLTRIGSKMETLFQIDFVNEKVQMQSKFKFHVQNLNI